MSLDAASELVIVDGARSPFVRAGQDFADLKGRDIARLALMHLLQGRDSYRRHTELVAVASDRLGHDDVDEARLVALSADLDESTQAATLAVGPGAGLAALARLWQARNDGGSGLFIALAYGSTSQALGLHPDEHPARRRHAARPEAHHHSTLSQLSSAAKLAAELDIDRPRQDEYADQSRRRARMNTLRQRADIVPLVTANDLIKNDSAAHEDENLAWLARLKPLSKTGGLITAGNCQIPADGAVGLLLARRAALPPDEQVLVRLSRAARYAGPQHLGALASLGAISRLLEAAQLQLSDIDLIELHESSCADLLAGQEVAASERLWQHYGLPGAALGVINSEALNIWGGAIALGHVTAASDLRMTLSLSRQLENRGLKRGVVAQSHGAGQATALLLERD